MENLTNIVYLYYCTSTVHLADIMSLFYCRFNKLYLPKFMCLHYCTYSMVYLAKFVSRNYCSCCIKLS